MSTTTDQSRDLVHSAKNFFYGTSLSRISGMLRDVSMAFFFGSTPEIAAFMLAYRFANLFRRLLGEGTLQPGFVPHFETLRAESSRKGAYFFRDFFFSLLVVLIGVVGLGEIGLFFSLSLSHDVLLYTMIMLPGLAFVCLYSLEHAHLQCRKKYFLGAAAPIGFNGIWIFSVIFLHNQPVSYLCFAVVGAFCMQWMLTHFKSIQLLLEDISFKEWFRPKLFSKGLKKMVSPLALGILGVGAMQINSALDGIFARIADPAGPAYLWYAIRLQQLPLALFGIAISGALLPPLSRAAKNGDWESYRTFFNGALRYAFALMLISTFALIVMGGASLNLLYGRGSFTTSSLLETLYCLWGYALALVPAAFVFLFAGAFYAKKEYKVPFIGSVVSVVLNIALNGFFVLVLKWGSASVAYATSISSLFNALFLFFFLRKQGLFKRSLIPSFAKTLFCGCMSGLSTLWVGKLIHDPTWDFLSKGSGVFPHEFFIQIVCFSLLFCTFLATLFFSAYLVRSAVVLRLLKKGD